MTGQSRKIQTILMERLEVTQAIAAENVEHLRLSQIASGMMVLDMKDEEDGADSAHRDDARQENYEALERCMARINQLERELADLDGEIDAAVKREDT